MKRSVYCGEVRKEHNGRRLTLAGWVHSRRDHGGVIFIDLRDRTGVMQVVFDPTRPDLFARAEGLRPEAVLEVQGDVRPRPEGTANDQIATGAVELVAETLEVLNTATPPPFEISDHTHASEEVRLRYRYLDLRRPEMQKKIVLRHEITAAVRSFLSEQGFLDIETPMLTRSTPEGARDFLVPVRMSPGSFYALPQSPQLFKQILMVAGFDRYFQVARCFRDEDLRADRQPEFTQIDIEMSFGGEDDIRAVIEPLVALVFARALGIQLPSPFPVLGYHDAMARFGSDRPDARIPGEMVDVTAVFSGTGFERIGGILRAGGVVKALRWPGGAAFSRKEIETLTVFAQSVGAKGLAWLKRSPENGIESPIAKFLSDAETAAVFQNTGAAPGDVVFLVADQRRVAETVLGALRGHLWAREAKQAPSLSAAAHFLWVTDFPLFEWNEEERRWFSVHHPFTSPRPEDIDKLMELDAAKEVTNPASVLGTFRARAYDLVLNGTELGGGSVRIHDPRVQRKVFSLLGLTDAEMDEKFGFLLEALASGAPPHAGIALGLDRMVALMTGSESIRDVIAFPKTQKGTCPTTGAPGLAEARQLRDLGILVKAPAPKPEGTS